MTKAQQRFQDACRELGCIVCLLFHDAQSPAEIHHMLSGGRRMGEDWVLPLCYMHHRAGRCDDECVSRDHNQRRFEERYDTEISLHKQTREMVGMPA